MNLKKINLLIIAFAFTGFLSCGNEPSADIDNNTTVNSSVSIAENVTSVSINFKNGTSGLDHVFYSNEEELFHPYLDVIGDKNAPNYKCGYSGNMTYGYKDGSTINMDFNLDEGCNHIVYLLDGVLISKALSENGRSQLLSLMEKGETIHTQVESYVEPMEPLIDIEKLTLPLMERLKEYDQKEMYEGGNPSATTINHYKFQPNENSDSYLIVQVILERGEVTQDEFAFYYPDAEGNFIESQYFVVSDEDRPCEVCNLINIENPNGQGPIATFRDRATEKEFSLNMGYNLEEVYFYWLKE